MAQYNAFDSHSSQLTNVEFHKLHLEIDSAGILAANTMRFNHIQSYYNSVYILYVRTKPLLNDQSDKICLKIIERYRALLELADNSPQFRGKKLLRDMLDCCNAFFETIVAGLQKFQYYIRVGVQEKRGLRGLVGENFSFEDAEEETGNEEQEENGAEDNELETKDY